MLGMYYFRNRFVASAHYFNGELVNNVRVSDEEIFYKIFWSGRGVVEWSLNPTPMYMGGLCGLPHNKIYNELHVED